MAVIAEKLTGQDVTLKVIKSSSNWRLALPKHTQSSSLESHGEKILPGTSSIAHIKVSRLRDPHRPPQEHRQHTGSLKGRIMRAFIYLGVITIVLALTEGRSMMSSGYGKPKKMMMMMRRKMMTPTKVEEQPEERCKKVGQFLTIPGEQCKFLVCDYGSEPWKDSYGNIKLFTVEMPCAPGTFVQDSSTNGYGITLPCAGRNDKMCLPQKSSSGYGAMPMKSSSNTMKMTKMMMKKKDDMQTMGYEQVMKMMKTLGKMMESSMYTVMTMAPAEKEEVEEMAEKAEHTGYGDMGEEEMKSMCVEMMKMMVKMEEMKESSGGYGSTPEPMPMKMEAPTGYGSTPMMMVMPMMGYGKAPEPAPMKMKMQQPMGYSMPAPMKMEMPMPMGYSMPAPMKMEMQQPMGYGMQPMMKMQQVMKMMKMAMKVMKKPQMMAQMGYGQMEAPKHEPEPQPTGYGMMPMMEAKPRMPSYEKMEQMMMKMMEKMEAMPGYGEMEAEMEEPQGYGKMEPEEMSTGYGSMEEMQKPMMIVMVPPKEMSKSYWD